MLYTYTVPYIILCHSRSLLTLHLYKRTLTYPFNLLDITSVWSSETKQASHRFWTSKTWSSCGNPTGSACSRTCRRSTGGSTTTPDPSNLRTSNDDNASCLIVRLRFWMQFAKNYYYLIVFIYVLLKKKSIINRLVPLYYTRLIRPLDWSTSRGTIRTYIIFICVTCYIFIFYFFAVHYCTYQSKSRFDFWLYLHILTNIGRLLTT